MNPLRYSLRLRLILLVLTVVALPLSLLGFWLAGTAARSGEELLRSRLRDTNERVAQELAGRWVRPRAALLSFAESADVQRLLDGAGEPAEDLEPRLTTRFEALPDFVSEITLRTATGDSLLTLGRGRTPLQTFDVRIPVYQSGRSLRIGWVDARLLSDAVLVNGDLSSGTGALIAIVDLTGVSLLPVPFDHSFLASRRFEWEGDTWVSERRTLLEPPLAVISAARLAEFTQPFERAAGRGILLLLGVTLLAGTAAVVLTRRMTRSLAELATAAEAVTRGDLQARVEVGRRDEVGRVAEAFNTMTESLRTTLENFSQREALAAVGSFAAELAHEVRNPLTALKIDVQYVEERLPDGSELKAIQRGAVEDIVRLDQTLDGVLQIARSGGIEHRPVDIRDPLAAAARVVEPLARSAAASITLRVPESPLAVSGDATALQQLFTNLLANSAHAVAPGGQIQVDGSRRNGRVEVEIRDDGCGIPSELLGEIEKPFFTTREHGTGLGLSIARRIAAAHRSALTIESRPGEGTTVRLSFPRLEASGSGAEAMRENS